MSSGVKESIRSDHPEGELPVVWFGDVNKTQKGLVVLQEWWGLNQEIQDKTEKISKDGNFLTLCPDLYRGKLAIDKETAGHYMGSLDWKGAVEDIKACVSFLGKQGCKKVGVTGYCMGGALSFAAAVLLPEVHAAAPFYGIPGSEVCDVGQIKIPLQCHFGSKDDVVNFSSPTEQKALRKKLDDAGVKYEFNEYDAGHAFTNPTAPHFDETLSEVAQKRMYDFMQKHLE